MAITATLIGFAFDAGSGNRELSAVFAVCYALGCLLAVLAVRQSGVFTAVIQPPLILFVAVPGAYFLFHGGQLGGIKDLAINCGYPLIERFPLMLFTSAAVLLIGLGRWYSDLSTRGAATKTQRSGARRAARSVGLAGVVATITSQFSSLVLRKRAERRPTSRRSAPPDTDAEAPRPRRRPADRPARRRAATASTAEAAHGERRATKRGTPPRPRPARPRVDEFGDPLPERPRRPRPPRAATEPPIEPRRRVRSQPREPRQQPPPERRTADRSQRRRRFDGYQPFEDPFETRSDNDPDARSGRPTHHPVSRVRYRGVEDEGDPAEYRPRPRSSTRKYES